MKFLRRFFLSKKSIGRTATCVLVCTHVQTSAQEYSTIAANHIWFDTTVGQENSGLYNGILFVDGFNVINDAHRFFDSPDFITGNISYDGQTYFEQRLKYDLYGDEVLVNPTGTSNALLIQLRKSKTEEFFINESRFINVQAATNNVLPIDLGFCQVLSEKDAALLLKKHAKKVEEKKNAEFQYHEFKSDNGYFLLLENSYHPVNTQREWIAVFPNSKKEIKAFYKGYSAMRKSETDTFHKELFQRFLDTKAIQK